VRQPQQVGCVFAGSTSFLYVIQSIGLGSGLRDGTVNFGHTGLCIFTPSLASRRSQSGLTPKQDAGWDVRQRGHANCSAKRAMPPSPEY
jgi:hypothetical protein